MSQTAQNAKQIKAEVASSTSSTSISSSTTTTTAAFRSASQGKDTSRAAQYISNRNGASSSTAAAAASSNNNRSNSRSPISPSRVSRLQEKEEMQNLNDRLAIYIETVRRLESDNNQLRSIVNTYSESSNKEVVEIKHLYENELEEAKRLIDELAKEKAKFEIEVNKFKADAEEALAKLAKRDKEAKNWEQRTRASEAQSLEFKSRFESLQANSKDNEEELGRLKPAYKEIEAQLAKLKKQLEDETLARVDLENKNQTLKEDLSFKSNVYDKEVNQLRTSKRVEVEQADLRLRDEYDSRLVSELQRIREETEDKILEMKDEVERRFQNKLSEAEGTAKRLQSSTSTYKEEIVSLRVRVEELERDQKTDLKKIAVLEQKCRDNEEKIRNFNQKHAQDMADKERDLELKNSELRDLMVEYQELYDVKIALDMEISAYRKLLESEEQRLNISNVSHHHAASSSIAGQLGASYLETSKSSPRAKRKRLSDNAPHASSVLREEESTASFLETEHNTSGIQIGEHDMTGKQVKLVNTTDKEVNLSGWKVSRKANNQEVRQYVIGKNVSVKPQQQLVIWSADAGVKQSLPTDLVMGQSQKWVVGDNLVTVLVDKEENEKARRETRKKETSEKKLSVNSSSSSILGSLKFW